MLRFFVPNTKNVRRLVRKTKHESQLDISKQLLGFLEPILSIESWSHGATAIPALPTGGAWPSEQLGGQLGIRVF